MLYALEVLKIKLLFCQDKLDHLVSQVRQGCPVQLDLLETLVLVVPKDSKEISVVQAKPVQ